MPAARPAHGLGARAGAGRGRRRLGGLGVGRQWWGREAVEAGVPRQGLGGGRGPSQGAGRALGEGGGGGLAGGGALAPAAPRPVPLPATGGRCRGPGQRRWRRRRRGAPAAAGAEGRGAHQGQLRPCGGERGRSVGMPPPPPDPALDPARAPSRPSRHIGGLIASDQWHAVGNWPRGAGQLRVHPLFRALGPTPLTRRGHLLGSQRMGCWTTGWELGLWSWEG